uniref:Putative secreted protein n=2 Tax=Anopheles marajoara TaxID=58244 RepID=A0A2M4C6G5_9DIPT
MRLSKVAGSLAFWLPLETRCVYTVWSARSEVDKNKSFTSYKDSLLRGLCVGKKQTHTRMLHVSSTFMSPRLLLSLVTVAQVLRVGGLKESEVGARNIVSLLLHLFHQLFLPLPDLSAFPRSLSNASDSTHHAASWRLRYMALSGTKAPRGTYC